MWTNRPVAKASELDGKFAADRLGEPLGDRLGFSVVIDMRMVAVDLLWRSCWIEHPKLLLFRSLLDISRYNRNQQA